jgi:RND family efflux transporter MFP subunit
MISCGVEDNSKVVEIVKPIKYAEILYSRDVQTKVFNGISKSGTETKLSFRASGLIVILNGKAGVRVKKGQLLAMLDQKNIFLEYEKAKSLVSSAKAQLETVKSNLERVKELYQSNSASLSEYEQARNSFANAISGYESASKSLEIQGSQFEYTKIIAPMNGIISEKNADKNEFAQAGSSIYIISSSKDDYDIDVGVPEAYITRIDKGQNVIVRINKKNVEGVVSEVGFSTGTSSVYSVIIKLKGTNKDLRPGMPAEVSFKFTSKSKDSSGLIAPIKSVGKDEKGNFVFVLLLKKDNVYSVSKRYIKIGELSTEGFIVKEGLKENEIVAIAGLRTLYEGMNVSLLKRL